MKGKARSLIPALTIFILLLTVSLSAGAQAKAPAPAPAQADLGILFSTDNLLLGLSGYQAGIGAKLNIGNLGIRGLLDFVINGSAQSSLWEAGVSVEYHFKPGRVSPYVGGYTSLGYTTQAGISSAVSFSLGGLAGVEIYVLDFLSLFAEYNLGADFSYTTDLQTSQTTFDYLIGTRMGNSAKLGIVIYIM